MLINMDESRSSWEDAIVIGFVSTIEGVMMVVDDIDRFCLFVMDCFVHYRFLPPRGFVSQHAMTQFDEIFQSSLTSDASREAVIEHLIGISGLTQADIIDSSCDYRRDAEDTVPDMIGSGRFVFSCFKIGRIGTERGGDVYFFVISMGSHDLFYFFQCRLQADERLGSSGIEEVAMREDDCLILADNARVFGRSCDLFTQTIDESLYRRDDCLLLCDAGICYFPLFGSSIDESGITSIESLIIERARLRLLCRTVTDDALCITDAIL